MLSSLVLLALGAFQVTSATPLTQQVSEVIPGPGLPSLESLGLTSAELYAMPTPASNDTFRPLFQGGCGPSDAAYAPVNDIIACYNYLRNLGTTRCSVGGPGLPVVEMCRAGQAKILAQSNTGNDESSYCSDVACGVLWVINSCTRPQQDCAGEYPTSRQDNVILTFDQASRRLVVMAISLLGRLISTGRESSLHSGEITGINSSQQLVF